MQLDDLVLMTAVTIALTLSLLLLLQAFMNAELTRAGEFT